jgi:hypothetical protein
VCAMSYYRKFIPKFGELAKPLMDLSALHPTQFKWLPLHQQSFDSMIKAIRTNTSLNLPDPKKPFFVQTDASDVAGAGRVFQKDDHGNELLMASVLQIFTRAKCKYGTFRKEVLALLYCLKSMDFFLRFANKVVILIDAKSILFLRLCKESQGILLRFSLKLSKYEAEIHHVPGVENEVSDVLSLDHKDIADMVREKKEKNILSEKQTEQILARFTIPQGKRFSAEEVRHLLELESLPAPTLKSKRKSESKAKLGKRNIENTPTTLGEKKVKLPQTSFRRPGLILPRLCRQNSLETTYSLNCAHTTTLLYKDFSSMSKFVTPGTITIDAVKKAQLNDNFIKAILSPKLKTFKYIEGVLFKVSPQHGDTCLVLPTNILHSLIVSKHFSVLGLHHSKTRIRREITQKYVVVLHALNQKLANITADYVQCQFNTSAPKQHILKQSNLIYAPE